MSLFILENGTSVIPLKYNLLYLDNIFELSKKT